MENRIPHIVTPDDCEKALEYLNELLKKGEVLKDDELTIVRRTAELIQEYEDKNNLSLIPRNKQLAIETDREKIAKLLGFEPDLIELIEFKMYQMKWNQNMLASNIGMPPSKVSQILNRKRDPDIAFLKGIRDKLGIDGNYILETV